MSEMTDNYLTNIAQLRILGEEEQYDFYKNDGIFSGLVNLFNNSEEVRENTNASIKYIRKHVNTLHLTLSNNMKYEVQEVEGLVISIILDMIFWARFIYIKTQFYKTKGIAYGNDNHYFSEFLIRDDKGYNYVGWVSMNIFSPLHTRGEVYTIYVSKINPKNAVMGNEPTIYLVLSIVFFVFVIFYLIVLALYWLM